MLDEQLLLRILSGKESYPIKEKAVKQYKALKTHADGEIPESLDYRRPNEPEDIKEYRKKIYVAKSEHPISKVLTSFSKIRRSQDWKIQYNNDAVPKSIPEGETLQSYLDQNYPVYDSLDNWLFDEAMNKVLIDINAVICVYPMITDNKSFIKPVAYIATSDSVMGYKEGEYAVIQSPEKYTEEKNGFKTEHDIYIVFTKTDIQQWVKSGNTGKYVLMMSYEHNLNELTCFRPRGIFKENIKGEILWKSPLDPMVPHLEECAREYSDLQAEKVLHIFSEKWSYTSNECKKCKGQGRIKAAGFGTVDTQCPECNGSGYEVVSPFKSQTYSYNPKLPANLPTPPAGYLQKDISITKLLDESVEKHCYKALESVNMQFLSDVQLNQSGVAKEWDRDETNNFAYKIASILVDIRNNVAYFVNELRFSYFIPNRQQREAMLPVVNVPQKYDIVTINALIEEYKTCKDANLNPMLITAMEVDIATKRFRDKPEIYNLTKLTFDLDPLAGISEDDKASRLQNGGIKEMDYIISCNIQSFVKRAMQDHAGFEQMEYQKQMGIIQIYAQEVVSEKDTKSQIIESAKVIQPTNE